MHDFKQRKKSDEKKYEEYVQKFRKPAAKT